LCEKCEAAWQARKWERNLGHSLIRRPKVLGIQECSVSDDCYQRRTSAIKRGNLTFYFSHSSTRHGPTGWKGNKRSAQLLCRQWKLSMPPFLVFDQLSSISTSTGLRGS
jgi:hypothetical protein